MQLSMTRALPRPNAGIIDDIEREDNKKGFEPDDLTALHQLVRHLTADGDRRAARAGRRARRTLAEMTLVGQVR
ncbi:hypothetical protein [Streptomyces sp. SAJ15]|uniref:hypothetical protein n=1 Tax=Streptomyces sp. SAJ15 TaxID=2011095 RepID=UPI001185E3E3|nr:hypothetical protein [Streptomyces sp. SAJ15]TVL88477.1 hypothetical protein CD790_31015 [Streptomyces sp. SAJ15]